MRERYHCPVPGCGWSLDSPPLGPPEPVGTTLYGRVRRRTIADLLREHLVEHGLDADLLLAAREDRAG